MCSKIVFVLVYEKIIHSTTIYTGGPVEFRTVELGSCQKVAEHISGAWIGPIAPVVKNGASSCSNEDCAQGSSSPGSLVKRVFVSVCKTLLSRITRGRFVVHARLVCDPSALSLSLVSSTNIRGWCWCGRAAREFAILKFFVDFEGPHLQSLEDRGITSNEPRQDDEEMLHEEDVVDEASVSQVFSTLLGLFFEHVAAAGGGGARVGGSGKELEDINERLCPLGWLLSSKCAPHPFFGPGRVFWRFRARNLGLLIIVHPKKIMRVAEWWPAAKGPTTSPFLRSSGGIISTGAGAGEERCSGLRMRMFSTEDGSLKSDVTGFFELAELPVDDVQV